MNRAKNLGQNFLTDKSVVLALIKAGKASKKDTILEIGAGNGAITKELAKVSGQVLAIEYDQNLMPTLQENLKSYKNTQIINADILKFNPKKFNLKNFQYKIIANIPFQITNKIIRVFLEGEAKPSILSLVVQKEVAEKICAQKNEASLLSNSVLFFGQPKIVAIVKKESFSPIPKVDSAILQIVVRETKRKVNEKDFFWVLRVGFSSPRKKLYNNLKNGTKIEKNKLENIFKKLELDINTRAQNLELSDWIKLTQELKPKQNV